MRKTGGAARWLAAVASIAILLAPLTGGRADAAPNPRFVVVLKDSVEGQRASARLERAHGFTSDFRYRAALNGFAAALSPGQRAAIEADPEVAYVIPDQKLDAVGFVPLAAGESVPTGVQRIGAATPTTAHEASVANVAVIDTGIDLSTQPELNAVDGTNCVAPGTPAQDDNGHGTLVAGVIGAKNDSTVGGIVGVAPGTKIYAVKVLDANGSGSTAGVICGIDWVTANAAALGIKAVNMSLGGPGRNDGSCGNRNRDPLHQAICRSTGAGLTYVVAAGNSGVSFARFVPAAYPEVLTVTAMSDCDGQPGAAGTSIECTLLFPLLGEQDDAFASFSNFATRQTEIAHTIAAPGVFITSTFPFGLTFEVSGTSIATPHVTGAVALCLGNGSTPATPCGGTPAQIIQRLRADAAAHAAAVPGYGFAGDPQHPVGNRYYGNLVWAGDY